MPISSDNKTYRSFAISSRHVYDLHENFSARSDRGAPLTPALTVFISLSVVTPNIASRVLEVRTRRLTMIQDLHIMPELSNLLCNKRSGIYWEKKNQQKSLAHGSYIRKEEKPQRRVHNGTLQRRTVSIVSAMGTLCPKIETHSDKTSNLRKAVKQLISNQTKIVDIEEFT